MKMGNSIHYSMHHSFFFKRYFANLIFENNYINIRLVTTGLILFYVVDRHEKKFCKFKKKLKDFYQIG